MIARRILPLSFCVAAAASCTNPELALDVQIPPSLRSLVRTIELHVYVPPAGGSFGCAELELGLIDAEARALSEAQVVRLVGRQEAPLRDIDRLAKNVFYTELLGENGEPIAFACAETAEFADDVTLAMTAEPAAHLEIPSNLDLSRYAGEVLQPRIPARVLDVLEQPVPGATISWTVASGEGVREFVAATTDIQGAAGVDPDLPTRVGPFVLVVRASWLAAGPVEIRGLVAPTPKAARLPGLPLAAEVGRFREGRDSVALLFGFGADRRIELFDSASFPAGDGQLTAREVIPIAEGAVLAALNYPGDELDRLVALATPGNSLVFTRFDPGGGIVEKTTIRPAGATTIRRVFNSGACRPPGRPMLTVIFEGEVVAQYDEQGNLLSEVKSTREEDDYLASGCMGDEAGVSRRVLVRTSPFRTAILEVEAGGGMKKEASWLDQPSFLSFTPPVGGPEIMLANIIQPSARAIVQAALRLGGEGEAAEVEVLGRDVVGDVPLWTAGLDADGDDRLDFATVVTDDVPTTGVREYRVRLSVPDEYLGKRISGSIALEEPLCYVTLLTGDFDGDGVDDVLVSELTPLACGEFTLSRVFLFPMGAEE